MPHCLSTTNYVETVEFDAGMYNGGIILPGKVLPSDLGWTEPRKERWGRTIKVQCFPLQSVLLALDNPTVDYFSLDVEGSEFAILKTLDWDKIDISIISVEMNHAGEIFNGSKEDIHALLEHNGFSYITSANIDDIFLSTKKKNRKNNL